MSAAGGVLPGRGHALALPNLASEVERRLAPPWAPVVTDIIKGNILCFRDFNAEHRVLDVALPRAPNPVRNPDPRTGDGSSK